LVLLTVAVPKLFHVCMPALPQATSHGLLDDHEKSDREDKSHVFHGKLPCLLRDLTTHNNCRQQKSVPTAAPRISQVRASCHMRVTYEISTTLPAHTSGKPMHGVAGETPGRIRAAPIVIVPLIYRVYLANAAPKKQ